MNSTHILNHLPSAQTLKNICKARAVLDAIICGHEFEPYHNYFKSQQEEYEGVEAQMGWGFEDEDGISLSFYFYKENCLIVPSSATPVDKLPQQEPFEKRLPKVFLPYFKKNFSNADIPFVIWTTKNEPWHYEENFEINDTIDKFEQLTTNAKTYKNWAENFFSDETPIRQHIEEDAIQSIYEGKTLTEDIVFGIVTEVSDWIDLEEELNKIPYHFNF